MYHYNYRVNYSKRFTKGLLTGLVYRTHMMLTDKAGAEAFIAREGEILSECAGSGAYRLEDMCLIHLNEEFA